MPMVSYPWSMCYRLYRLLRTQSFSAALWTEPLEGQSCDQILNINHYEKSCLILLSNCCYCTERTFKKANCDKNLVWLVPASGYTASSSKNFTEWFIMIFDNNNCTPLMIIFKMQKIWNLLKHLCCRQKKIQWWRGCSPAHYSAPPSKINVNILSCSPQ